MAFYRPTITIFFDLLLTTVRFENQASDIFEVTYKPDELIATQIAIEVLEDLPNLLFNLLFRPHLVTEQLEVFLRRHSYLITTNCSLSHHYLNLLKDDVLRFREDGRLISRRFSGKVDGAIDDDEIEDIIERVSECLEDASYMQDMLRFIVEVVHVKMIDSDREGFQNEIRLFRPGSYLRLSELFLTMLNSFTF